MKYPRRELVIIKAGEGIARFSSNLMSKIHEPTLSDEVISKLIDEIYHNNFASSLSLDTLENYRTLYKS